MSTATDNPSASNGPKVQDQPQDMTEVGWLFLQQYYTFLNEHPEKLHRFYTRNSTFCHGVEGESVSSCLGQTKIGDKIKEHGFQDCKVLVSNFDCQLSSQDGVIIQVLGEMSNKGGPSQKFVQTFFLAPQPRGYYVLNDIFRFLKEDVTDIEDVEEAVSDLSFHHHVNGTKDEMTSTESVSVDAESSLFSQTLSATENKSNVISSPNGTATEPTTVESTPSLVPGSPAVQEHVVAQSEQGEEVEKHEEWADTPVVAVSSTTSSSTSSTTTIAATTTTTAATTTPPAVATTTSAAATSTIPNPAVPSAPVSWAALAAKTAAKKPAEQISSTPVAASIVPTSPAGVSSAKQPVPATAAAAAATGAATGTGTGTGQPRKGTPEYHSAYIKHVNNRVDDNLLRKALEKFGQLTHFQVEKSKNCAFVDFADPATLKAALAAHELTIGDQIVLVEERKRGGAKKPNGQRRGSGGPTKKSGQNKA
jgi:hypothetical protein